MKELYTPWFPMQTRPFHIGLYQVKLRRSLGVKQDIVWWSFWDGSCWWVPSEIKERALFKMESCIQEREWRGLTTQV
jgi:hypothetical protein